ncbi:alpha-L-fucosidase 3-like isoform X2 [Alnus glutinosa]|uniref:alpha-L-fucosidase 3-like isoform X2 n=1 Tax=Alnus glutinosa TaxID=3517 RepID=UPI002D794A62|nr:alpha-L-fucosidase 3-like isoform X2 [Alnus glutinosa]
MVPYILVHALVRFHNLSYSSFFISLHSQLLLCLHLSRSLSNMEPQCLRLLIFGLAFSLMTLLQNPVHASTDPCDFPAIFNFGDSNSDTGGLSAAFGQASSPHGESYFHGPAGRYCDGRLLIDFMAESLGLPYLNAYLDAVGSNFSHGANFATAGSTIRPQNTTLHQSGFSPFSFNVQWYQFHDFHNRSQIFRSKGIFQDLLPKAEDFSRALYTFDIGQNDLTAGYFLNMSTHEVEAYVPDVLDQFKAVVKYIYGEGGRSFWIHNTGPVGCLPYILDRFKITAAQVDKAGCATPFNDVAQYFNRKLKQVVVQLRKDLPLAALTYVDVYSLKYSLYTQPRKHGFAESLRACCGHGGKYNYNMHVGCGGMKTVHGRQVVVGKPCQNPSAWINWDGVHYTQAANKWLFDQIVGGSFSDPPVPLKFACHTHHQSH